MYILCKYQVGVQYLQSCIMYDFCIFLPVSNYTLTDPVYSISTLIHTDMNTEVMKCVYMFVLYLVGTSSHQGLELLLSTPCIQKMDFSNIVLLSLFWNSVSRRESCCGLHIWTAVWEKVASKFFTYLLCLLENCLISFLFCRKTFYGWRNIIYRQIVKIWVHKKLQMGVYFCKDLLRRHWHV